MRGFEDTIPLAHLLSDVTFGMGKGRVTLLQVPVHTPTAWRALGFPQVGVRQVYLWRWGEPVVRERLCKPGLSLHQHSHPR